MRFDHEVRDDAEQVELADKIVALTNAVHSFETEAIDPANIKTVDDVLTLITRFKPDFDKAYEKASKTPTLDDDIQIFGLQERVMDSLEKTIDKIVGLSQDQKNSLIMFTEAQIRLSRAINSPKVEYAEPQKKAAQQALRQITDEGHILAQSIPAERNRIDGIIQGATDAYNRSGLEDIDPLKNPYEDGEHDLEPAIDRIDTTLFKEPNKADSITNELRAYAKKVSTKGGRKPLDQGEEERVNEILRYATIQREDADSKSPLFAEAQKLEHLIRELLHENNVARLGGSQDARRRDFLRPSLLDDDFPADMDGLIQMMIGSYDQEIQEAEVLGRIMAAAKDAGTDMPGSLRDEDREFLRDFKDRFSQFFNRQLLQLQESFDLKDSDNQKYLDEFTLYMNQYLEWLKRLNKYSGATVPPGGVGGPPRTPGIPEDKEASRIPNGLMRRFLSSPEVGFREDQIAALGNEELKQLMWGWYFRQMDNDVGPGHLYQESGFDPRKMSFPGVANTPVDFTAIVGNMPEGAILNDDLYTMAQVFLASKRMYEYRQRKAEFTGAVSTPEAVYTGVIALEPFKIKDKVIPIPGIREKPTAGFPAIPDVIPERPGTFYHAQLKTIGDYTREAVLAVYNKTILADNPDSKYDILFNPTEAIKKISDHLRGANPNSTFFDAIAKFSGIYIEGAMQRGIFDEKVRRDFYQLSYLVNTGDTRAKYVKEEGRNSGSPGLELTIPFFHELYKPPLQRYPQKFAYDATKHPQAMAALDGQRRTFLRWLLDGNVPSDAIPTNGFPEGIAKKEEEAVGHSEKMLEAITKGTGLDWLSVASEVPRMDKSTFVTFNKHQAEKLTGLERAAFYYWNNDYKWPLKSKTEYDELMKIWTNPARADERITRGLPLRTFKRDHDGHYLDAAGNAIEEDLIHRIKAGDTSIPDPRAIEYVEMFTPKMCLMGNQADHALGHLLKHNEINKQQYDFLSGGLARVMDDKVDDQCTALIQYQMEIIFIAELMEIRKDGAKFNKWRENPEKNIKAIKEMLSHEAYLNYRGGWRQVYYNQSTLPRTDVMGRITGQEIPEGKYTGFGLLSERRVNDLLVAAGLMNYRKFEQKKK